MTEQKFRDLIHKNPWVYRFYMQHLNEELISLIKSYLGQQNLPGIDYKDSAYE